MGVTCVMGEMLVVEPKFTLPELRDWLHSEPAQRRSNGAAWIAQAKARMAEESLTMNAVMARGGY